VCLIGMPHSGQMCPETFLSLTNSGERCSIELAMAASSLLCHNFNQLWCQALNGTQEGKGPRPEFFAMHHSDIAAPPNWLDRLIEEMEARQAVLCSAVVAIKDFRGLTSTALLDVQESKLRRITVRELDSLPETFDAFDVAKAWGLPLEDPRRYVLCANTGLWACRFSGDWVEQVAFENGDRIVQRDGEYVPMVFPEDWMFSSTLAQMQLKVVCTKKFPLIHFGRAPFATGGDNKPWGHKEHDDFFPV
jgi:hypothetical protein